MHGSKSYGIAKADAYRTWAGLQAGYIAAVTYGKCRLVREGEKFVMTGPTGEHALNVAATDEDRLRAHWRGFCYTTEQRGLI